MTSSVLDTTKKVLGVDPSVTEFDTDLIVHINSIFATLHQMGVNPTGAVHSISDKTDTWEDYIREFDQIAFVQTYMYAKVRLLFDPPQTSFAIESLTKVCEEYEYRMNLLQHIFV